MMVEDCFTIVLCPLHIFPVVVISCAFSHTLSNVSVELANHKSYMVDHYNVYIQCAQGTLEE